MHLLRAAHQTDAAAIVALTQAAYQFNQDQTGLYGYVYEETPTQLVESWSAGAWRVILLEDAAGTLLGCVRVRWDHPEHVWLARLAVLPEQQGQGYGRKLLEVVEGLAAHWGRAWVQLGALEASPRNRALYERLGYEVFDRREMRHAPGHFYHVMRKQIMAPQINDTVARYELIAADYNRRVSCARPWIEQSMERLQEVLAPGAKILDVGCGPGRDSSMLQAKGYAVVALDATSAMLAMVPLAKRIKGDSRALPVADAAFDGVWASASLLHLPRQHLLLALWELYRILRPGGICFVSLKQGTGEGWSDQRWFAYYQPQELQRLCAGAGFELIEQSIQADHRAGYPDWIQLWMRKSATGSALVHVKYDHLKEPTS